MNWHQTIELIRKESEYKELVKLAYFDANLLLNVERFGKSDEFQETLKIVREYAPNAKSIVDIGAGNGISSVNFALNGYNVVAVEPDPSNSVGANAIKILKDKLNLKSIEIFESYAEEIGFENESFDIVYVRQAMHHAYNLDKFVAECARILKPSGILFTVRDHVIFNQADKELFLASHPLHKYYGGENAFLSTEYKTAMKNAGLTIVKELKYYDSVINYFPLTNKDIDKIKKNTERNLKLELRKKIGVLSKTVLPLYLYRLKNGYLKSYLNEKDIPGRMYSYIAQK